jgi:DNA-binding helix-hairpin-helix protein with protein kinase domain
LQKERQLRQQQIQAEMAASRLEMAKAAEAQREELQRLRQSHAQTRMQVQEMQDQIYALHEQIRQLLWESHQRRIP